MKVKLIVILILIVLVFLYLVKFRQNTEMFYPYPHSYPRCFGRSHNHCLSDIGCEWNSYNNYCQSRTYNSLPWYNPHRYVPYLGLRPLPIDWILSRRSRPLRRHYRHYPYV